MTAKDRIQGPSWKYLLTSFGKFLFALAPESTVTNMDWTILSNWGSAIA
jgi:hypothetical protein